MEKLSGNCSIASDEIITLSFLHTLAKKKICIRNNYQLFTEKNSFSKKDLDTCSEGQLFGEGNAQLPSKPLLMLDRIVDIQSQGGKFNRGFAVAEIDITPEEWFFEHHFKGDPIMPGCFLIEAIWQLTGFHLAWSGYRGRARVVDSGRTRFLLPVAPSVKKISIAVQIKKIINGRSVICIADGQVTIGKTLISKSESIKITLIKEKTQ